MIVSDIKNIIEKILDNNKAQNIISINLKNKSYIADYMIIASGTSSRHLQALSEILVSELKKIGLNNCRIEGKESNEWKLVDTQDVIVHIFIQKKESFMIGKNVVRDSKRKGEDIKKFYFSFFASNPFLNVYSKNDLYENRSFWRSFGKYKERLC